MKLKVFHKCFLCHGNAIDLENSFLNRILRTFQKRGFETISRDNFGSRTNEFRAVLNQAYLQFANTKITYSDVQKTCIYHSTFLGFN